MRFSGSNWNLLDTMVLLSRRRVCPIATELVATPEVEIYRGCHRIQISEPRTKRLSAEPIYRALSAFAGRLSGIEFT
jgi:hypothetical protein